MGKAYLFINVVGFKYIARNRARGYEILCWDLNTKISI